MGFNLVFLPFTTCAGPYTAKTRFRTKTRPGLTAAAPVARVQLLARALMEMLTIAIICIFTIEPIIRVLYGDSFNPAAAAAIGLAFAAVFFTTSDVISTFLCSTGIPKFLVALWIIILPVKIAVSYVMIGETGLIGPAISGNVCYLLATLVLYIYVRREKIHDAR